MIFLDIMNPFFFEFEVGKCLAVGILVIWYPLMEALQSQSSLAALAFHVSPFPSMT